MSGVIRDPVDEQFPALSTAINEKVQQDVKSDPNGASLEIYDSKHASEESPTAEAPTHDDDGELWVLPTEEERSGPYALRRVVDKIPWSAYLVGVVEMAERFSFYGSTAVFTNYVQRPLPPGSTTGSSGADGTPGAFGLGTQAANGLVLFNAFWSYVTPLFGAYVADTYLGRFKTISWSIVVALVGHVLLIISSIPGIIEHSKPAVAVFSLAVVIMGIGTGFFKANISPLVAEQYKNTRLRVKTLPSGERVIIDPALTISRMYMWFYLLINVGSLTGSIGMTYSEKYVGFWLAYTLPTIVYLLSPIVLFLGRKMYVHSPPTGSVLATAMRILRKALEGTVVWSSPSRTLQNWRKADFWEKAKPSVMARQSASGEVPSWVTFDDQYVDQVARGFKACQVFVFYPLYWISYNQMSNNLVGQAATMITGSVPNDVINNLNPLTLIIFIPICAKWLYPMLARCKIRFTPIKRIFFGFMTGTLAMIWSTVVQLYIYRTSPCGYYANGENCAPSPLSVWIQSGSYVIIAFSEIFASITGLEYAFTKAPKNMRSLVLSVFLFTSAVGSAINQALNPLAVDPHFIWNYGASAIICFVAGLLFWLTFRNLDAQEDALNEIGADRGAQEYENDEKRS